jgi:hypothetical protein
VIRTYDSAGSHEATLAVSDDDGATSGCSTTVVVQ